MTFIVDRKPFRTYDPDRGYELFNVSGSSDGSSEFKIIGPEGECTFRAKSYEEHLRPEELEELGSDYDMVPVVCRILIWPDDWRTIIREAMTAKMSFFEHEQIFVRFGNGSVFDE